MQQAVFRKDLALEESARKDWEDHMQRLRDDPNSVLNYIAPLELKLELESGEPAGTDTDTKGIHNNSRCCQLNQGSRFRHLHPSLRSMDERDTQRVREGSAWILEFRQKLVPRILASHSLRENGNRNRKTTETTMQKVATTTPTTTDRPYLVPLRTACISLKPMCGSMPCGSMWWSHALYKVL
jgi:hypothetical protein